MAIERTRRDSIAHAIAESLLDGVEDVQAVLKKIESFTKGLSKEDRFIATALWLGKTKVIHKIENKAYGSEAAILKVPDLFLAAEGRPDVSVEVKSTEDMKLVWSDAYISGLRNFGLTKNSPVLVATYWEKTRLWSLNDLSCFAKKETSWHLTFEDAMPNSLMSWMLGDFVLVLRPGTYFDFKAKILDETPGDDLEHTTFTARVVENGLRDSDGNEIPKEKHAEIMAILMHVPIEESTFVEDGHFHVRIELKEEQLFWGQTMVGAYAPDGEEEWRTHIEKPAFKEGRAKLIQEIASRNFGSIVKFVMTLEPCDKPAWMTDSDLS